MRLLLTRAAEDAVRTRERLEAAGHAVLGAPLLRIQPLPAAWPGGLVDAVLATSGHAFAALPAQGAPAAADRGPAPEARRLVPLLLVGERTRESARAAGFLGAATVAANAAVLAVGLGKLAPRPRRIVYLAGRDRKPDVEAALRVMKQPLDVVETYEARAVEAFEPAAVAALRGGAVEGVLHFSQRSAAVYLDLTRAAGLDPDPLQHFCLSEDVAAPLRNAGCSRVTVAEAANEAALLACLGPDAPPEGEHRA